jgi:hypothetical protein
MDQPIGAEFLADTTLKAAARLCLMVAASGPFLFASTVASFYVLAARRGDFQSWNKSSLRS